jgi:hypothetical protein
MEIDKNNDEDSVVKAKLDLASYQNHLEDQKQLFIAGLDKSQHASAISGLRVGDVVTYTNSYGVKFGGLRVIGFCKPESYANSSVFLDKTSYWAPVKLTDLKLEKE